MDDIDHSNKSRKRNNEKHFDEINNAIKSYFKRCQVTASQYNAQENRMKEIEKHFIDLSHHPELQQREIVEVKILNGLSPKELFVLKTIDEPHANQFHRHFQHDYNQNQHDLVFCLKTGLFCVAKTSLNGWQRCRILSLHKKGACTAFLLDIGVSEQINWSDLRMLDEKWCGERPFAIRCSMVDIVSANAIERYTPQQQLQFTKLIQMQNKFFISVNRSGTISSDIFLYYVMDNRFHCVNVIFPSHISSTDDDESNNVDHETHSSSSRTKIAAGGGVAGADIVMHSADSTFVMREHHSSEEMSMLDENQNEMKKENTMNDIEMKDPSDGAVPKQPLLDEQPRLSKPEAVIIQHIDESGSIFVNFKKHKEALKRLRFEIQKRMTNNDGDDDFAWNINDHCLVHGKFDGFDEWLRGRITHIWTASAAAEKDVEILAQVYLRDIGTTVEIPLHKLRPPISSMRNVQDFAWHTRLAFIEIKQADGQIERFGKIMKKILHAYDEIEMSVVNSLGGQLNVILWGIIRNVSAMLPEKIELANINQELVNGGHAVALTEFNGINDLIGNLINVTPDPDPAYYDSDNIQSNSTSSQSKYNVTEQIMDVKEWLPSEPILQHEFAAAPMYVSQNCILSVLEGNRHAIADEMAKILEKKYRAKELECRDATEWKKEDPCFVRFSGDRRFYRGSVRRVNLMKDLCMVRFIDYGNCESCSFNALRKANMFGNIPVLARLYQLDNIRPLTEDGKWPEKVRKFCLENFVEKPCNVIQTDDLAASKSHNEPTLCTLELFSKDKDLASLLVASNMAEWIQPVSIDETA